MGKLGKDAKDLLIGKDGSENEPKDFKTELEESIKAGILTKAEGTLLVTARMNVDKLGENIDKHQLDAVKRIKSGEVYENAEEEKAAIKKKEEKERRRKEKEEQIAIQMNKVAKKKPSGGSQKGIEHDPEQEHEHVRELGK